jgi:rod shape determining protein RodA
MFETKRLRWIDWKLIPILLLLAGVSLVVISSYSQDFGSEGGFLTPTVKQQLVWYGVGFCLFFGLASFDYRKFREWSLLIYVGTLVTLLGLFFVDPIQNVHRWYRLPGVGISLQPSEYAKLAMVITLSWFLERNRETGRRLGTVMLALLIVLLPFVLILKEPDLGTSLVLIPIALVMFYFGGLHPFVVKGMTFLIGLALIFVALKFTGVIPHEGLRPYAQKFLKEYQYDRLDPNTHHQRAAQTAIAIGGLFGTGVGKSEFTGGGWLPMPYTDSVFPAFGEEVGLVGLLILLGLLYSLVFLAFRTAALARDAFGRLLAAGIGVYLAMHILINIGMMIGFLPITGVPLILITYGGSSLLSTMAALGILQSIYARRFSF